ncbi:MAG: hypothetical protein E7375_00520 [Clostridiales bacterium]|nr:hypothetical protein [Clostridiales bacterium]
MDFVLLGIALLYFIKGFCKGFVAIVFSLCATILTILLSIELSQVLGDLLVSTSFFDLVQGGLQAIVDKVFSGEVSTVVQLMALISGSVFGKFLLPILQNVEFDGNMSAGQILSPTLSLVVCRVLLFLVVYLFLSLIFNLIKKVFNKKLLKITYGNRFMGGVLGVVKGILISLVVYALLYNLANLFFIKSLVNFCEGSVVLKHVYEKIVLLFGKIF